MAQSGEQKYVKKNQMPNKKENKNQDLKWKAERIRVTVQEKGMGRNLIMRFKCSHFPNLTGNGLCNTAKRKYRLDIRTKTSLQTA